MKPHEIRAELIRNQIRVMDIASGLGIAQPSVSQVISGAKKTRYVRQAIAESLKKPISDLWPD